ncbi:MAG: hypothetical protein AAB270_06830 [Chloroflexota bacterium]
MEKRSVLDTEKGAIIIKTRIFPDGQLATEITAVDLYRGKNVSVGLGPRELEALQRHIRELKRARRSQKARETQSRRRPELAEGRRKG